MSTSPLLYNISARITTILKTTVLTVVRRLAHVNYHLKKVLRNFVNPQLNFIAFGFEKGTVSRIKNNICTFYLTCL
jgi:hypothetical protein